jgi:hypothetical protein
MKYIFLALACLGILSTTACKKKDKAPEEEYFSFEANGVHYDYPAKRESGFLGESKTPYGGLSTGSLGYFMGGSDWNDKAAPGRVKFQLYSGFPDKDTILLGVDGKVSIYSFINQSASYSMIPPYGKIIFTERSSERLIGTFEFYAELYNFPTFGPEVDTVLHITNGKFSIIPD